MNALDHSGHELEAARVLEGVLVAVRDGVLTADGRAGAALVKRLEGALIALRVLDEQRTDSASARGELH